MILQTDTPWWTYIINILWFVMIFISVFYGTKLQAYRSARTISAALEDLKKWDSDTRARTIKKLKQFSDKNLTIKDLERKLDMFLNYVAITPTDLDPAGIIPKIEQVMDVREDRWMEEVKSIAVNADSTQLHNLENLLEAAQAVNQVYRIVLHYLLLGKKMKSYILLLQVEMQLAIIKAMAKAYVAAASAFEEGSPIGDALGPMVVANLIRDITKSDSTPYADIAYETISQEAQFEGRKVFIVRAKGPGGTVGKPGEGIKKIIEKNPNEVKLVIMIDAGLKLEGDKTGSVVIGVGAAIGGIGVEKFKIEASSTDNKIPIDAIICRQSLKDAITTMKNSITNSVPKIVDIIKDTIRKRVKEGESVIVAGIGNTIGIGI
ncbi:MAG: DUF1512 family protein [Candidatus Lokiarchaeota archaeon]|nr:DUF1512 family protein [Candidatus Lokiarchaeota archaeon]